MADSKKTDTTEFINNNLEIILPAYNEHGAKKAYEMLVNGALPEMGKIAYTTFKQYLPVFMKVFEKFRIKINEDSQKIVNFETELEQDRQKIDKLEKELAASQEDRQKIATELEETRTELEQDRQKIDNLEKQLAEIRDSQKGSQRDSQKMTIPKKIEADGKYWSVTLKQGYYRMYKKINGKMKWLYVGKEWNPEIAKAKIKEFTAKGDDREDD